MQGCCTFCNPACLRLLGYASAEDLLGKNMHVLIHHAHADGSTYLEAECQIFRAFHKGEGTHVADEVFWRADGTYFPAEYWSHPQRNGDQVVGAVVTFFDITESKRAEEKLRLAQTSVEQASDAVFWLDSQGRIVLVNAAACRSLASTRAELLTMSIGDIVPDFSPEAWAAEWENAKLTAQSPTKSSTKLGREESFRRGESNLRGVRRQGIHFYFRARYYRAQANRERVARE